MLLHEGSRSRDNLVSYMKHIPAYSQFSFLPSPIVLKNCQNYLNCCAWCSFNRRPTNDTRRAMEAHHPCTRTALKHVMNIKIKHALILENTLCSLCFVRCKGALRATRSGIFLTFPELAQTMEWNLDEHHYFTQVLSTDDLICCIFGISDPSFLLKHFSFPQRHFFLLFSNLTCLPFQLHPLNTSQTQKMGGFFLPHPECDRECSRIAFANPVGATPAGENYWDWAYIHPEIAVGNDSSLVHSAAAAAEHDGQRGPAITPRAHGTYNTLWPHIHNQYDDRSSYMALLSRHASLFEHDDAGTCGVFK